ncbi:hypothetical protein ACA910_021576 [Epithemia clementina (nom. ined.)]
MVWSSIQYRLLGATLLASFPSPNRGFVVPPLIKPANYGRSTDWNHDGTLSTRRLLTVQSGPISLKVPTTSSTSTKLLAAKKGKKDEPSLNLRLVAQNLANQAFIGSTIWTGGSGFEVLMDKADFGPLAVLLGVAGVLPLLAISRAIETSDSYALSGLNLATNMAVLRLFGAKPQPISAFVLSALMAVITGVVEETIFRGQAITFSANRLTDGDVLTGAFLSTLLFAFLHTNPLSFFKGGDAALDNLVLFALQFVNGAVFAFLYVSTGNLAVPIITHALYDFYIFYKTHMVDVAGQMDYASREAMMPKISNRALEQRWILQRGEDFVNGVKQSFFLMDVNRDGVLSKKELRIALFSYGINLSESQTEEVYRKADLDGGGDIDLDEFLQFVGPEGSTGKAVRNTLLGPI